MAKLWACLVTLEMNKAIELLCAEGKNKKFSKTVLRRHGKVTERIGEKHSVKKSMVSLGGEGGERRS